MPFHRLSGAFAFLSVGVALSLGGCKDENIDVNGFVNAWSERVCDAVVDCNCEYPGGSAYDHCVSQLGVGGSTEAELNKVEGLSFDGACAQEQIDRIGSLGCGVFVPDPNAKCERPCKVWHGPMGTGATCTTINGYDNCAQGLTCDGGVCVNPCAEPDLPSIGESCAPGFGCEEGAWCDTASMPLVPTCKALPSAGEPCLAAEFGYACGEGLQCDLSDADAPVCATLPGEGEECPDGICGENLLCDTSAAPAVCATAPALGETCSLGICAAPNLCEGGVCVEPRPQVCGFYGGVPEGLGTGGGGTGGMETGGMETGGVDTGIGDTGLETTGGGLGGDCCTPHGGIGCDDQEVLVCVCSVQPSCCSEGWTQDCVDAVTINECGGC